ncbi:hypothetical protein M0802_007333 [Mischocyttarus mexicanus]|nr:hypothetical protein M0802_007333 [Mischocyttarus mexicanus]
MVNGLVWTRCYLVEEREAARRTGTRSMVLSLSSSRRWSVGDRVADVPVLGVIFLGGGPRSEKTEEAEEEEEEAAAAAAASPGLLVVLNRELSKKYQPRRGPAPGRRQGPRCRDSKRNVTRRGKPRSA